jgi:hypothetical protein
VPQVRRHLCWIGWVGQHAVEVEHGTEAPLGRIRLLTTARASRGRCQLDCTRAGGVEPTTTGTARAWTRLMRSFIAWTTWPDDPPAPWSRHRQRFPVRRGRPAPLPSGIVRARLWNMTPPRRRAANAQLLSYPTATSQNKTLVVRHRLRVQLVLAVPAARPCGRTRRHQRNAACTRSPAAWRRDPCRVVRGCGNRCLAPAEAGSCRRPPRDCSPPDCGPPASPRRAAAGTVPDLAAGPDGGCFTNQRHWCQATTAWRATGNARAKRAPEGLRGIRAIDLSPCGPVLLALDHKQFPVRHLCETASTSWGTIRGVGRTSPRHVCGSRTR